MSFNAECHNSHQTYACHHGKLLGHCPCHGFWSNKRLVNELIDQFIDNDKSLGVLFYEIHQSNLSVIGSKASIIKGARWRGYVRGSSEITIHTVKGCKMMV